MKARRAMLDVLIIAAGVTLLASPFLIQLVSFEKSRPFVRRARLLASAPFFGFETNAQNVYPIITLTLSNAGPTDLQCQLEWFDCRARNGLAEPLRYSVAPGGPSTIAS